MNFLFLKQKNKTKKGFTLIEMLIAVFIFSLALTSLMLVSSRGLKVSKEAQNQITADYLALEAIEAVRNVRDSALIRLDDSNDWTEIFDQDGCLTAGSECTFVLESGDIKIIPCSLNQCDVYLHELNGVYRNFRSSPDNGFDPTQFTREINFIYPTNNREIITEVIVRWNTGSVTYSENLFLWL